MKNLPHTPLLHPPKFSVQPATPLFFRTLPIPTRRTGVRHTCTEDRNVPHPAAATVCGSGAHPQKVVKKTSDDDGYNPTDDFAKSIEEAYRVIRERMANGGPEWTPKEYKRP